MASSSTATTTSCFSGNILPTTSHGVDTTSSDLDLAEPFSPLVGMEWMDHDTSNEYLDGLGNSEMTSTDNTDSDFMNSESLDWLSDVMHLDSTKAGQPFNNHISHDSIHSTSDPLLTPRPPDVMSIFEMDEVDFRTNHDSGINWDKLIGQNWKGIKNVTVIF